MWFSRIPTTVIDFLCTVQMQQKNANRLVKSAQQQLTNVLERKRLQLATEGIALGEEEEGENSPSTSEKELEQLRHENVELKQEVRRLNGHLVDGMHNCIIEMSLWITISRS